MQLSENSDISIKSGTMIPITVVTVISKKAMHTSYGDKDVAIPCDRNGEYEPQLIKKYQNTITWIFQTVPSDALQTKYCLS